MLATEDEPKIAGTITGGEPRTGQEPAPVLDPLDPDLLRKQCLKDHATVALLEIGLYEKAGVEYAALCGRAMDLDADRPAKKLDAIRRIMQRENDLTGQKHSYSSAEKAVETDLEYRSLLQLQAEIVQAKELAYMKMRSADRRSELAIAQLRAEAKIS